MGLSNEQVEMLTDSCEIIKGILGDEVFTEVLISFMNLADLSHRLPGEDVFADDSFTKQAFTMFLAGYVARVSKHDQNRH